MNETKNESKKNLPEEKYRAGGCSVTVWKNTGSKDGRDYEFHTVVCKRSYKKGEEWKQTDSLRVTDLPKMQMLLGKAYEYLTINDEA